jgi:hypothetical protein
LAWVKPGASTVGPRTVVAHARFLGPEGPRNDAFNYQLPTPGLLKKFCWLAGQALDALRNRRVRREQAAKIHAQQRLHDE